MNIYAVFSGTGEDGNEQSLLSLWSTETKAESELERIYAANKERYGFSDEGNYCIEEYIIDPDENFFGTINLPEGFGKKEIL